MKQLRLNRKTRTNKDIGYVHSGGIFDLFDNHVKSLCRINDAEYDFILDHATDAELNLLVKETLSFAEKKTLLLLLQTSLTKYYDEINN